MNVAYALIVIILFKSGQVVDEFYQPYSYEACEQERTALIASLKGDPKVAVYNIECEAIR